MSQLEKAPDYLHDANGYPTEEWLDYIRNYQPDESVPLTLFIDFLRDGWWMPDWGFHVTRKYKGECKLKLSTGGWSGNSEVIDALMSNIILMAHLRFVSKYAGGHYTFKFTI